MRKSLNSLKIKGFNKNQSNSYRFQVQTRIKLANGFEVKITR
jgi:hypothetical protein